MIVSDAITFDQEKDPIKTERCVYDYFKNNHKLNYVAIPIAYSLNTVGVIKTQQIINDINTKYNFKKIYVCQHISVNRLYFGDNYVFTPHTTSDDGNICIPHYNPSYNTKIHYKNNEYLCSFMGDFSTHEIRKQLIKFNNFLPIIDTNGWFFYKNEEEKQNLNKKYKHFLQNSYFSFCPQGTGPSSLRLYESISAGSFPIIFNNLKIPNKLEKFVIRCDIQQISKKFLEDLRTKYDEKLRKEMIDIYWEHYSNKNLYKSINYYFDGDSK